ncbi:hypothetical protein ACFLZY_02720 [Patescibacteria group bacterium]
MKKYLIYPFIIVLLAVGVFVFKQNNNIESQIITWPFYYGENSSEIAVTVMEKCTENFEENGFSFKYPCDWRMRNDYCEKDLVCLIYTDPTSPGDSILVYLGKGSFENYNGGAEGNIGEEFMHREDFLSFNETLYPITRYVHHGGVTYVIDMNEKYAVFGSEFDLDEKGLSSIFTILTSLQVN